MNFELGTSYKLAPAGWNWRIGVRAASSHQRVLMGNLLVDIMIMKLDINLIELLISMLGVKAQAQVLKIMFIYTMNNTL